MKLGNCVKCKIPTETGRLWINCTAFNAVSSIIAAPAWGGNKNEKNFADKTANANKTVCFWPLAYIPPSGELTADWLMPRKASTSIYSYKNKNKTPGKEWKLLLSSWNVFFRRPFLVKASTFRKLLTSRFSQKVTNCPGWKTALTYTAAHPPTHHPPLWLSLSQNVTPIQIICPFQLPGGL